MSKTLDHYARDEDLMAIPAGQEEHESPEQRARDKRAEQRRPVPPDHHRKQFQESQLERLMRMRDDLMTLELRWGLEATAAERDGEYELAAVCRWHSKMVKRVRLGRDLEDLFEQQGARE